MDILKEKKVEFHIYQPRQQGANLHHSLQQELVTEDTERTGHKIINLWNFRHSVTGNPFSSNNEIYHIKNIESKLSLPTKSKIIFHNARDAKRTSIPRGTAHTDQDV
jgi:hypothetical protein